LKTLKNRKFKIRDKIIAGFIFISLFVWVESFISANILKHVNIEYEHISNKHIPLVLQLTEMKFACLRLISSASEFAYIQTESKSTKEISPLMQENDLIQKSCNSCHTAFAEYEILASTSFPELAERTEAIRKNGKSLQIAANQFVDSKKMGTLGNEALEKKELLETAEMEFLDEIEQAIKIANEELKSEKTLIKNIISTASRNNFYISSFTFVLSILIGFLYTRSISKPIIKLTKLADDFQMGNLDANADIKSNDEIGVLGKSFHEMAVKIKLLISKLEEEVKTSKQVGESLKKSNQQTKLILEVAGEGIYSLDPIGNITSINPIACKILGYNAEELIGMNSHKVFHYSYTDSTIYPEDKCPIFQTLSSGKNQYGEDHIWKKDGTFIPIEFNSLPIIEDEMISGAVITFNDITDRKRKELENQVMYEITQGVATTSNLDELLKLIHLSIKKVVYAENCFVALFDQLTGLFSFPFFVDKFDSTPAPVAMDKSCTAYVFRTGKSQIITNEIFEQLKEQNEVELIGSSSPSWIGIPLNTPTRIIGVLVLQNYEEKNAYNQIDINFLDSIASQIALVIERKKAEESIKESQSLYYSFIEQLPNPVFRKDLDGRYILVNSEFCRLKGLKKEDFIGRTPKEVAEKELMVKGEQSHAFKYANLGDDAQKLIFKNGSAIESEEEYSDSEGNTKLMTVFRMPVLDSNNNIIGTQGIMFDITSRKQAEELLREGENKLKVILESTADGILAVDGKNKVIKTNKRFAELWHIPQTLIDAADDNALLNFVLDQLVDKEQFISKVRELYNSTQEDMDILEFKDGRIFERFSKPLLMSDSSIGRVWSFRDITERMGALERLRESEDRFRNLVENISDVFFIADGEGKLIYCSPNFFTQSNYLPQNVYGKSYFRFVAPIDRKRVIEFYAERRKNNVLDAKIDLRAILNDGSLLWIEQNTRFVRDNNNKVIQYRIVVRDISERKRAEEEIKEKNEQLSKLIAEKDKFFAIIAHDLKSPFQGLLGLSEVMAMEEGNFTKNELLAYGKDLHSSASNLFKLLENLLEWAQIQRGTIRFAPKINNLYSLVTENIEVIKQRAVQKEITIVNELQETETVFADHKMLDTIIRNLLSNAVKFTKRKGEVSIKTQHLENNWLEVSISDTGIGMSADYINKLFKADEKTGSKGTEGELSTGLGLLLCKEFVEKLGGQIWAESEEGKGSIFKFTIQRS